MTTWPTRLDAVKLSRTQFDVIIVGGGIHGCGIARDAALRGLRVALFERGDIASGTSSASSKLAHGGLRYLETLQFGLVRESLRERATLLRLAPHLVRPLPFLLPLYDSSPHGRLKLKAGLSLYDLLAGRSRIARHGWVDNKTMCATEPGISSEGLGGGFRFSDAQMNDARLCLENALDARAHGAELWNYVAVERLIESSGRVEGVSVRDGRDGNRFDVRAHTIVNATGPWYDSLARTRQLADSHSVRLSKGSHIVVDSLTKGHALLLSARSDGRAIFVLPYKGRSIVGTTDIEIHGSPDDAQTSDEEIRYLLDELKHVFGDRAPREDQIHMSYCGVRSLRADSGANIGDLSREANVVEEAPGLLGVIGGKLTTYRAVSERVVDQLCRMLERARPMPCRTAQTPLPGGGIPDMNDYFAVAEQILVKKYDLPIPVLRYLLGQYGSRHTAILRYFDQDPSLCEQIEPNLPFTRGEVVHAVREEGARTLEDLIRRRTYRAFLSPLSDSARRNWEDALRIGLTE